MEEDAEKLMNSLLTPEQLKRKIDQENKEKEELRKKTEDFTAKDVLAMTIAILQIIVPYFLIAIAGMVAVYFFFVWMGHR
ncbi:MAG: hypothetical protein K6G61_01435 [Solobacterium sp.]|nr:hypothetical protein [Solobacterium sp.]